MDAINVVELFVWKLKMSQKTQKEREKEVSMLMEQFLELGISIEHPSTQEFIKIAKGFKDNGWSAQGVLKFKEYERKMEYLFTNQPHITSGIVLKYTGDIKPKIDLVTKSK